MESDFMVVSAIDALLFPAGNHVVLEGDEAALCGIGRDDRARLHATDEPLTCPSCAGLLDEALHVGREIDFETSLRA